MTSLYLKSGLLSMVSFIFVALTSAGVALAYHLMDLSGLVVPSSLLDYLFIIAPFVLLVLSVSVTHHLNDIKADLRDQLGFPPKKQSASVTFEFFPVVMLASFLHSALLMSTGEELDELVRTLFFGVWCLVAITASLCLFLHDDGIRKIVAELEHRGHITDHKSSPKATNHESDDSEDERP